MKNWFIKYQKLIYWAVFAILLAVLAYIQYYGLLTYHYLVPPGDDPANHLQMMMPIYNHTQSIYEIWRQGSYPPGYHLLISSLAHSINVSPLQMMLWTYPGILILTSVGVFLLAYRLFGPAAAMVALLLYSFIARTPPQLLSDGGYPNLLAASFLLPIFVIFFLEISQNTLWRKIIGCLGSLVFAALILFTHHLSSFYLIGLVFLSLPFLIIGKGIINKWNFKKWITWLLVTVISMLVLLLLFVNSEAFIAARELMKGMVDIVPIFPYFQPIGKADPSAIWPLASYPYLIAKPIVFFGLFGFLFLPFLSWRNREKFLFPYIILIVWTSMLLVGSQFKFLSNPERLFRDAVVPLSVLASATIIQIFALIRGHTGNKLTSWLLQTSVILYLVFLSIIPVSERIKGAIQYNPMIRFTNADNSMVKLLKLESKSGRILIGSFDFYFNVFLPEWNVHYLYRMSEESRNLVFNPQDEISLSFLKQYDYLYFVSNQKGWVPSAVRFDYISKYIEAPGIEFISAEQSETNEVLLFKVVK